MQTTRRKSKPPKAECSVVRLKTARAKIMARQFIRAYRDRTVEHIGEESDRSFRRLKNELECLGLIFKRKLKAKRSRLNLKNFPGPPETFDLPEAGNFQKRVFEVLMVFDDTLVHMESAWLHRAMPYGEHAAEVVTCEERLYDTLSRVAKRYSVPADTAMTPQSHGS